jgi:endonuclease I
MKKYLFFITCLTYMSQTVFAQAPDGYYNNANGKCGQNLRSALESIISNHKQRSYDNLWTDFYSTDTRSDGKVWDMYSNTTNFTFGTDKAGNYSKEGDVYNREHSFPKSWFNDATPMYTDLYHIYPTDGYVNGRRSNYPFGEVGTITYSSNNKFSKLGTASNSGYSGTVFEPADEYKGDFARTYFYMVTCYASKVNSWSCDMLSNNDLSTWAINLLLKWSENDPVSEKEKNRIEAVYKIQGNRNPFIDCPGLEEYIWGNKKTTNVDMNTLTGIINATSDSNIKIHVNTTAGLLHIEAYNDHTPITVCDIAGRIIVKAIINKGEHDYPLQKGIYLIDGKKVMVN